MRQFLVLRFSSFGDVLQSLSIAGKIKESFPEAQIHWITRSDFVPLVENHPGICKVYAIPKKSSVSSLWSLAKSLSNQNFDVVYDAHNNLRSHLFVWFWRAHRFFSFRFDAPIYLRKSQKRIKRFMLFQFRKNFFQMPFSGQRDLLEALQEISLNTELPRVPQLFVENKKPLPINLPPSFIALAPSSAHELKRWPVEYWSDLISKNPMVHFVFLGGKEDLFIETLHQKHLKNTTNVAGKLTMMESAEVVQKSLLLITNDTGPLHIAEQLGHQAFALMGPAPFGFPSRPSTKVFQKDLKCRTCIKHGQNPCTNPKFHQCLRDISVNEIHFELELFLKRALS
ncbi:MAG: glycosyltransferase family 9 protein [Pseudobdellovibrionaceae bacterium]